MSECDRCGSDDGTTAGESELLNQIICSGCWNEWEGLKADMVEEFVNEYVK